MNDTNSTSMRSSAGGHRADTKMTSQPSSRSDVLYIVAWATLGQAACFLIVSMFLGDVMVLPTDPLTIIGTSYVVMGIMFMFISCLLNEVNLRKSQKCASKSPPTNGTGNPPTNDIVPDEKDTVKKSLEKQLEESKNGDPKREDGSKEADENEADDKTETENSGGDKNDIKDDTWQMLNCSTRAR